MKPLALSTMYAQQPRFDDGAAFVRYAAQAGYAAIDVSHSTDPVKFQQCVDCGDLPVTSVHQPAPRASHTDGRHNGKLNLAALDEDERAAAVYYARESFAWAARIGATRSVVHLGHVEAGGEMFPAEYRMRRLFDSGQADAPEFAERREQAIAERAAVAEPHVAAARRSLLELVQTAEHYGITLGIENRYHFHELPHPAEYDALLEGLVPEQAGYWHDVGHAEVLDRLGFIDRHAWLDRLSTRCVGAHLHDVVGLGDHRAPGDGDVDWRYIVAGLRHLPTYTLEINQHQSDERVRSAIGFLERIGLA